MNFRCACETETPVKFKKPSLVIPVVARVICKGCESKAILNIYDSPKFKKQEFRMVVTKFIPSDIFIEAAEAAAKEEAEKQKVEPNAV